MNKLKIQQLVSNVRHNQDKIAELSKMLNKKNGEIDINIWQQIYKLQVENKSLTEEIKVLEKNDSVLQKVI